MEESDKQLLIKAASNVRHLISHLANEGKPIEGTQLAELLAATSKIGELTPEEETSFWKGYASLVKDALPARVDALYYSEVVDAGSISPETKNPEILKIFKQEDSLRRIRRISIAAFTMTLLLFAYLSIGESAMQRSQAITAEYASLKAGVWKATSIEKTYEAIKDESRTPDQGGRGGPAEGQSQQYDPPSKESRLSDLIDARIAELTDLAGYNANILKVLQLRWFGDRSSLTRSPVNNEVVVTQQSVDTLISKYLLPIFTALLGVTVFILRTASANLKQLSFRTYESGIYSNRLALGVVGGIAISWFSVTDTSGIVGSITPAALAFLVGYSVEVLYNVLDSLVKALGANERS